MYSLRIPSASLFLIGIALVLVDGTHSHNVSSGAGYTNGCVTWYGDPTGSGSPNGACGYANDVSLPPYNCMIAAAKPDIFNSGKGCGGCYEVKCTEHPACSGFPIAITIADKCPECTHPFDLSGKAFGCLAKPGQADILRKAGKINVQYRRVQCHYNTDIKFKIDKGSNPYYLAFVVEHVGGDGDIASVEVLPANSNGKWVSMQQSWGETWKADLPEGMKGPFTVKLTTLKSGKQVVAKDAIPANWFPGQKCNSKLTLFD